MVKSRGALLPGADLPQPLVFGNWDGIVSDLTVTKATDLLKLFLTEAVPLDFLFALSSPLLKKVLGTKLRMKLKHAIRRREAFLKGWTSRLAKIESKMHCFRPLLRYV